MKDFKDGKVLLSLLDKLAKDTLKELPFDVNEKMNTENETERVDSVL